MFLLKTILRGSAIVVCLSCNNLGGKKASLIPAANAGTAALTAPVNNAIPEKEAEQYRSACSSFFDSLLLDHGRFNGGILVAKEGTIVYEKYAGFANPRLHKDSLTPNSAFHLASVSKTFTAMSVLKLWEQGRLNLNDDLSKYFPNFPYSGVTIKMLLSHRSGLPNYVHYMDRYGWDKRKMATNPDVLNSLYTMHPPLENTSGRHFSYCNTNYALLALIIEKATGHSYADFLQETFFTPLQMHDTYVFALKDTARAMRSYAFNNREFPMEFLDEVYGDKNVYSTARDMLKWDQALYAGQFFKQSTLDSAFAGYSFEKEGKRNYGLGWRMTFLDNGKKLLYHNGWWHGNNSVFVRLVDEKATIIVLGNKFNKRIYASKKLSDLFGPYMQTTNGQEEVEGSGGGEGHVRTAPHGKVVHRRHHRKRKK